MKGYTHIDREPFPVHTLKRVERPTTIIMEDKVARTDEREQGFNRAGRGDFGKHLQEQRLRFVRKQPLSGALLQMEIFLKNIVDGVTASVKAPLTDDPQFMSRHIKETAYFLRADMVGICELPSYAVYTHGGGDPRIPESQGKPIDLTHRYAISILIDQDWRTSRATSGHDWISNSMSFMSYSTSGFIACILADYIRRLGYPARAHHALNYQVAVPPILLLSGLGEMSRIGDIVLNPFLGPRFKAAVVTTDLPLIPDKPIDFGLQDFCSKCKKCARECPGNALSEGEKIMFNGYEKWPTDVAKCTAMRVGNMKGSGCGTCIKVCPWNKPYTPLHRAVGWTMRHSGLARSIAIWGDDLMGYGKPHPDEKWWLDLEDVEGVMQAAGTRRKRGEGA